VAIQFRATSWLELVCYTDDGFEPNRFGLSGWASGVFYARVQPAPWLYVAGRSEVLFEQDAASADGAASPIFWPSRRFDAHTATLDFRPAERVSVRLEARHDGASRPLFFEGDVRRDGAGAPIPTARGQTTVTVGATTWF
jgi:hypothetical protein